VKGERRDLGFQTLAIHAGQPAEATAGAVVTPIFQTSTYAHLDGLGGHRGYEYARSGNPTRTALESNLAALEGGAGAQAFASGMAAISALMTLVRTGQKVVASRNVYGGTFRYFMRVLDRYDIEFAWVDTTDLATVEAAIDSRTRLVYLETPTNPLMEICDIQAIAEMAHARGAAVAVDNTFLSPFLQNPLALGADVVVHSTTKYLNGHSDSIGGALVSKSAEDAEWFKFVQKSAGAILGPFECFLVSRGIKTLGVRMERHESNAKALVSKLDGHPKVQRLLYPGLPSHPGHAIQRRQARGFGGVFTLDLGSMSAARQFLEALQIISLAESLGGVESLASHSASMTHASVPAEQRALLGITEGMVRVSAGIESEADLLADVARGLDAIG
jgi:cystathionine beta-lyase/cystathionine gamma-synthase